MECSRVKLLSTLLHIRSLGRASTAQPNQEGRHLLEGAPLGITATSANEPTMAALLRATCRRPALLPAALRHTLAPSSSPPSVAALASDRLRPAHHLRDATPATPRSPWCATAGVAPRAKPARAAFGLVMVAVVARLAWEAAAAAAVRHLHGSGVPAEPTRGRTVGSIDEARCSLVDGGARMRRTALTDPASRVW